MRNGKLSDYRAPSCRDCSCCYEYKDVVPTKKAGRKYALRRTVLYRHEACQTVWKTRSEKRGPCVVSQTEDPLRATGLLL